MERVVVPRPLSHWTAFSQARDGPQRHLGNSNHGRACGWQAVCLCIAARGANARFCRDEYARNHEQVRAVHRQRAGSPIPPFPLQRRRPDPFVG